jgi:hypothetical protein
MDRSPRFSVAQDLMRGNRHLDNKFDHFVHYCGDDLLYVALIKVRVLRGNASCGCRVLTQLMFRDCSDGLANLRYLGGKEYIHRPPAEKSATLSGSREEIPRKCCQNEETNRSFCPHSTCATLRHIS